MIELIVTDITSKKTYMPAVQEGMDLYLERFGSPGKLSFKTIGDQWFNEGSPVRLSVNGTVVFYGFIFSVKQDKDNFLSITAYDQIRYLQNKDSYVYKAKTATQVIRMIADDFKLQCGELADTKYVIPARAEDSQSLLDIIKNALELTLTNTKEMYVLYDDNGKLTLKNISDMQVKSGNSYLVIDKTSGENFNYESSIDRNVANKVKLLYSDDKAGVRDAYIAQDGAHINEWGVLQHYEKLQKGENGQAKADALLKLYNQKAKKLKISKAFGDVHVRGGSLLIVSMQLGDMRLSNQMLVESVTHHFENNHHTMDLTLRGAGING